MNILITTVPFGKINERPLELLKGNNQVRYIINPLNRKLKEKELKDMIQDFDIVIAGTEPITKNVLESAKNLKLISRVGIGLDNVDLTYAKKKNINVSYTPDAPTAAVSELTIGHMINLMRHLPLVDREIRSGKWQRMYGERLSSRTIGIIGTGRIGSRVLRHLQGFDPNEILVNDLNPNYNLYNITHSKHVEKDYIYRNADIISLHIPLTKLTKNLITKDEIKKMKDTSVIINTSRGGIVNEIDLYTALKMKNISGAAIDVFESEPYSGNLIELDNCLLSCHMGSMTKDCRARMELEATEEALRFVNGKKLQNRVPEEDYINHN